jgi:hypothetical protein
MHVAGRIDYEPSSQSSWTSTGPRDVKTVTPPRGAEAMAFSLESPPIRVTFDGKRPNPKHGIKLSAPEHFFPFAKSMKFASVEDGRSAIVNVLWLKLKPKK